MATEDTNVRKNFVEDNSWATKTDFVHLNERECQSIVDNYKSLSEKIKSEKKTKINEEIYYDFTVSDDCFISFRKYTSSSTYIINIWIKGEKYTMKGTDMINSLEKFLKY